MIVLSSLLAALPALPQPQTNDQLAGEINALIPAATRNSHDGRNGLRVLQILSPEDSPNSYGFSPRPTPKLIATYRTAGPALAVSKGIDRDRAVDESSNQIAVFGRRGARPFDREEASRLFMQYGVPYTVPDEPPNQPSAIATATKSQSSSNTAPR